MKKLESRNARMWRKEDYDFENCSAANPRHHRGWSLPPVCYEVLR